MNPSVTRDINRLSTIAARILSAPDIYDIENLTKAGTCGEYAVFLKKKITDQLLPFVARLSDGTIAEILYQNPRKVIDKERDREEICTQITASMLRVVAIVIACLGSIQIARTVGPIVQRGGATSDVINWLVANGYILAEDINTTTKGRPLKLITRHARAGTPEFFLTFGDARDGLYHATITAKTVAGGPEMPTGGLRVNFTNPIDVPGKTEKILPIRVTDNASIPWMVGILYRDKFETLNTATSRGGFAPEDIWEQIFIRASGTTATGSAPYYETREQLSVANDIFNQFRRSNDPRVILTATERFLTNVLGYYPGYVADTSVAAGGVMPVFDAYGRALPYAGPGIIPRYPGAGPPPYRPSLPLAAMGMAPLGAPRPIALTGAAAGFKYDIPLPAGKYITETLTAFRNAIPTLASPAAVRANTLMASIDSSRIVRTGVCTDPYWSQTNLGRIYPWVTLQFLCIDNWRELTPVRRDTKGVMSAEWNKFLSAMFDLYNDTYGSLKGPRLTNREGLLNEIKFEGATSLEICKDPARQQIKRIDLIQNGLTALHDRYDEHVTAMWDILNSLIVIIKLPDTGVDAVRIHPQVFKSGKTSKEYIDEKATRARETISKFYVDIERIYLEAIRTISPPRPS